MKITKQIMKDARQLIGKTKEKVHSLPGNPDHLEFGGMQLIYITRSWFRRNALVIELDMDEIVESTETVCGLEIYKAHKYFCPTFLVN